MALLKEDVEVEDVVEIKATRGEAAAIITRMETVPMQELIVVHQDPTISMKKYLHRNLLLHSTLCTTMTEE